LPNRERLKTNLIFAVCVVVFLVIDLWSKSWVQKWVLRKYGRVQVQSYDLIPKTLGILYRENRGGVFGWGQGKAHLFIVFTFVALGMLGWLFWTTDRRQLHLNLGIALITSGALGNLYDRLFNQGRVRDFIDFHIGDIYRWYTFNVADSCICVGVGLLMLDIILHGTSDHAAKAPAEESEPVGPEENG